MKTFNLSRWALEHKSFVVYLMLVIALAGIFQYRGLGREEDPPFTIKTMVVKTMWPGATTLETMQQVTDRIEKKLEELPNIDYQKSYTKPGESVVFVYLKDSTRAADVPISGTRCERKIGDIKHTLPQGVQGPFFNDEFGDTYALIFALTSDGFSHREVRDYCRARANRSAQRSRRRKDRSSRHPGRENLSGVLDPATRRHGSRYFRADRDSAGAKRHPAERDGRL
jgi:multidrug efflux pump subunit AcrB